MHHRMAKSIFPGVLALGCLLGACQPPQPPGPWIALSTEEIFDLGRSRVEEPAFAVDLADAAAPEWIVWPGGQVALDEGRMQVLSTGSPTLVWRIVDWDATEIDVVEVVFSRLSTETGRLKFHWAGPGEELSEELSTPQPISATETTYRFELREHPLWSGRIARMGFHFPYLAETPPVIESITAFRSSFDEQRLAALAVQDWKVEIDDSLRNARLATPGHPVSWPLAGSGAEELRFSFGLLDATSPASTLRVSYLTAFGRRGTAFETQIRREDSGGWGEARVDLRPFGRIRELVFEPPASDSGFPGIAVWANPTLRDSEWQRQRPNVVLVSLDTLRSDRLSAYGYPIETSPAIDAWAASRGVLFENVVASAPRTLPSHVSMFTGLDALTHGVNHHSPAPLHLETLAERLREAGYSTLATVGGGLTAPRFGMAQGFDEFYTWPGWPGGFKEIENELSRALEVLDRASDTPFFLFFHTYEIHDPFQDRPPHSDRCYADRDPAERSYLFAALPRPRDTGEGFLLHNDLVKWRLGTSMSSAVPVEEQDLELVSCLYDSGIGFADQHFAQLLDRLETLGLLDETLIVLTSDHGEALGEKDGQVKHAYLYENNLMVPLIFDFPGHEREGISVASQVASVDIVPTVLEYLDLELGAQVDGRSLLPLLAGAGSDSRREAWSYAAHENRGISLRVGNRVKYTYNNSAGAEPSGREELFRLAEDPLESQNLIGEDPELARRLRARVAERFRAHSKGTAIRLRNASCDGLDATLRLPGMLTHLKAVGVVPGSVRLLARGTAGVSLRPGQEIELLIETSAPLGLELRANGCPAAVAAPGMEATYRLAELASRIDLRFSAAGWQEGGASDAGAMASVTLEPRFGSPAGRQPEVDEPEVLEQLRKLGYLP